jgi:hypothetical protein
MRVSRGRASGNRRRLMMPPPPPFVGAQAMIARGFKLFTGVGAAGFGIWAMVGSFASSDGAPAVVSGHTAIVRASQDGYISLDALRRGSVVHSGAAIGNAAVESHGRQQFEQIHDAGSDQRSRRRNRGGNRDLAGSNSRSAGKNREEPRGSYRRT